MMTKPTQTKTLLNTLIAKSMPNLYKAAINRPIKSNSYKITNPTNHEKNMAI